MMALDLSHFQTDCEAILKKCGYKQSSVKKLMANHLRSGDIHCNHPTVSQMIDFLQLLHKKLGNGSGFRAQLLVEAIDRLRSIGSQSGAEALSVEIKDENSEDPRRMSQSAPTESPHSSLKRKSTKAT